MTYLLHGLLASWLASYLLHDQTPQSQLLHPNPHTRNPKPETLNPKPEQIGRQNEEWGDAAELDFAQRVTYMRESYRCLCVSYKRQSYTCLWSYSTQLTIYVRSCLISYIIYMSGIAVADVTLRCRCNDDHLCVELLDKLYAGVFVAACCSLSR